MTATATSIHLYLEKKFGKYTLEIKSDTYSDTGMYQHTIEVYKDGQYERAMMEVINSKRWFADPFVWFEAYELHLWAGIKKEVWENAIRELHEEYRKIRYPKKIKIICSKIKSKK